MTHLLTSCTPYWLVFVCAIVAGWVGAADEPAGMRLEESSSPIRRSDLRLATSASCAATACHGGPRAGVSNPYAVRGSEYPLWFSQDPHARSWRTMCSKQSEEILSKLKIVVDGKIQDQAAYDNCLACHNSTLRYSEARSPEFHAEGIGCVACHGPSEQWRSVHFQGGFDRLDHSALGYVGNQDLLTRARVCAACHVGDADRDMNHDIIAAGHPALRYEFSTYHHRLPKHWREPRSGAPEFEAQLWLAGQIASLDAQLCLLEHRARGSLPVSIWPEFAAADCASCHQQLRLPTAPGSEDSGRLSLTGLSKWSLYGMQALTQATPHAADRKLVRELSVLDQVMRARTIPDRMRTAEQARASRRALDQWIAARGQTLLESFNARQLTELARQAPSPGISWEAHAQYYLAVLAAREAWESNPAVATATATLRASLFYEPGSASLAVLDWPGREVEQKHGQLRRVLATQSDASRSQAIVEENASEDVPNRMRAKPPAERPSDVRFETLPLPSQE